MGNLCPKKNKNQTATETTTELKEYRSQPNKTILTTNDNQQTSERQLENFEEFDHEFSFRQQDPEDNQTTTTINQKWLNIQTEKLSSTQRNKTVKQQPLNNFLPSAKEIPIQNSKENKNTGFFKNGIMTNDIVVLPNNEINHNEKFSITQSNQENLPKGTNKLLNFNRDDIVNLNESKHDFENFYIDGLANSRVNITRKGTRAEIKKMKVSFLD